MSDSTDTTRLADIRRGIQGALADGYVDDAMLLLTDAEWLLAQLDAANATIATLQQAATDPAADRPEWQERLEVAAAALVEMADERDMWRERAEQAEDHAMAFASQTGYTPPE